MNYEVEPQPPQSTTVDFPSIPAPAASASAPAPAGSSNPQSLFSVLATMPSGNVATPLTSDEMKAYLADQIGNEGEIQRNQRHAERDEMYRDGGKEVMKRMLTELFRDPDVREFRMKMIPIARYNNALKRIVNELSTVYSKPAKRTVKNGNDNYQRALKLMKFDQKMFQLGRLLNLHRLMLVGPRIRKKIDGTLEPVLDLISPAKIRAIVHPNDSSYVVAWAIRTDYRTIKRPGVTVNQPAWNVWSAYETFQTDAEFRVLESTYVVHGFGLIPYVPVALTPPDAGVWCGEEGEDLVSTHKALWFINILSMKETKSATKINVVKGDGTNTARGQMADTEGQVELSDGQSMQTMDLSMDLEMFNSMSDHVLQHGAQNYGMSPALIKHQGVQSAQARELMRIPLTELREQQQVPLLEFEADLCKVISVVLMKDGMQELEFDPTGFAIEFGDPQTPLSKADDHNLFVNRRQAGIANTVEYMMQLYRITEDEARKRLANNYIEELARLELAKPLAAISGGSANQPPAEVPPEETDRASGGGGGDE